MIIKCEIDIRWLDDEGNIDEVVKNELIDRISGKLSESCVKDVTEWVNKMLFEKITDKIDNILSNFMEKPIMVTDNWGDKKAQYENVNEMLKERFDNFLTEKVNKEGKPTNECSYGDKFTRIDFFLKKEVTAHADKMTKQITDELLKKVDEIVKEKMKDKLAQGLLNKLGLDNLL